MNAPTDHAERGHQSNSDDRPWPVEETRCAILEAAIAGRLENADGRTDAEQRSDHMQHAAAGLNLSHELRTPTNAILGHVELLLCGSAGPLSSDMRISLAEIQQAAIRLSSKISDIVEWAETVPATHSIKSDGTP